jgi:hypothetical protein
MPAAIITTPASVMLVSSIIGDINAALSRPNCSATAPTLKVDQTATYPAANRTDSDAGWCAAARRRRAIVA